MGRVGRFPSAWSRDFRTKEPDFHSTKTGHFQRGNNQNSVSSGEFHTPAPVPLHSAEVIDAGIVSARLQPLTLPGVEVISTVVGVGLLAAFGLPGLGWHTNSRKPFPLERRHQVWSVASTGG